MELRRLRADLHIHTCLSPCGELAMSPRAVVDRAREVGLDLIAVTDHLGLFDPGAELGPFQAAVFRNLPDVPSKKKFIKDQVIVDADDYVTGFSPRCLFGATRFSVHEAVDLIHGHGGLAVACHVDRESFSIVSQLGFIPPGLPLDAVEVSPRLTIAEARQAFGPFDPLPMVRFSDAHNPEEIGRATTDFLVASPDLGELRKALSGQDGRRIVPS
jgi:hypothetical protein